MSGVRSWHFGDGLLLAALVVGAVVATLGAWEDIVGIALHSAEQSHILLGLPIAAWLAWVRRDRLRYCRPRRSWFGPVMVALGWGLCYLGFSSGTDIAWHLGALLVVAGAAISVIGTDFVREFMPAVGALVFLLPVPGLIRQSIALPLQEVSAKITQFGLEMIGVPIERAGNLLTVNGHDVAIAEACNGMRMVAALGLVAYAFVFTVPMRTGVRMLLLAVSPLVALVVNVIRLVPTTVLYGYADKRTADLFHELSGWGVLVLALGMMWTLLATLRWIEVPIAPYAVAED
jgi:exosortase